jgi:murein DD-endopeptidase MepM/ murein hydrolase activator NlpD
MQRFLRFSLALSLSVLTVGIGTTSAAADAPARPAFSLERFPVPSASVEFTDTWGARRSGGRRHRGIDILGDRGTPIVAIADGVVTFVGIQRLSGYTIKIDHGDGWSTAYLHLDNDDPGTDNGEGGERTAFAPWIYEGVHVLAGEVIGHLGDSGNAERTTPHLHFEIKHDGEKINPYPYLEEAWLRGDWRISTSHVRLAI